MFTVELYQQTPATERDFEAEVILALGLAMDQLRDGRTTGTLHDSEGRPMGWWECRHEGQRPTLEHTHPED